MDKLIYLANKLNGKIKSQQHYNVNFDEISQRQIIVKNFRDYEITIDEYADLYVTGIKVNSRLSFSINRPDIIFGYKMQKSPLDVPFKVYVSDQNNDFFEDDQSKKFLNSLIVL